MRRSPPKPIPRYGTKFRAGMTDLEIEIQCIRNGGQWPSQWGGTAGLGLAAHYKNLDRMLWPNDVWDDWDDLINSELCKGGVVGIAGPSSSGKTHGIAKFALKLYRCFPNETTVLISSTTLESLERRVWGEIKKYWKLAREVDPAFPGVLTDSRQEITTDGKEIEGRDRRNGVKGVACKKGNQWVGLGDLIGTKNKRVALLSDEAPLMMPGFFDAMGNLRSNDWWLLAASGNPKDPLDAFGKLMEPREGWDQLVQGEKTQTWRTRDPLGRAIRLDGLDCPNLKHGPGKEPCKGKLTWRYVSEVEQTYGKGSWQWEMWVRARFLVNVMEKRLFVRKFCERFRAFSEPEWTEGKLTRLVACDAAFGAVGGDRCVVMDFQFGPTIDSGGGASDLTVGFGQNGQLQIGGSSKQRLALLKTHIVPVDATKQLLPFYQIAHWCKDHCEELGVPPNHFFFDSSMRGEFVSAVMQVWSPQVVTIDFGGTCTDRPDPENPIQTCYDAYVQFVTELNFALRAVIRSDQFRGMTLDIVREAEMRAWDQVAQGTSKRIKIESKDKMKERVTWSPDLLDCCCTGVEGARRLGFEISRLGRNAPGRRRGEEESVLEKAAQRWKDANKQHALLT